MTPTPHTAEALAAQLDRPHWTGLPIELHVEAAAMLRAQAQEIERLTPLQYRQAPCHKFCESNAYEIELRNEQAKTSKAQVEYKTISAFNDTLRAENDRLREALKNIAGTTAGTDCNDVARAALEDTNDRR